MAKKIKNIEVTAPEVVKKVATKKANKVKKEKCTLIKDVSIGGVDYKKGDSYPLTEEGKKYFKSLNYIK